METQLKSMDVWTQCRGGGVDGKGGQNWETRFDINTLPGVKQTVSGKLPSSTASYTMTYL